jgi:hypothetical protein
MKTIQTVVPVNPDRTITVPLPPDLAPGAERVAVVVVVAEPPAAAPQREPLRLSAYDVGVIDPSFTFRREDLYGDDGR